MKKVRDKMIDFIIVEDNLLPLSNIKIIIDKVMINYDIDYQITILQYISFLVILLIKK